jgi:lipoprotein-releasing system permease protein
MSLKLSLFFAKRYIVSKKSNNAINFISWISVFAISVGTAALIIVLSGMNGLNDLVKGLYNSFDPEIEITAKAGKTFVLNPEKLKSLKELNGIQFLSQTVEDNVLIKYGDHQMVCKVKGVDEYFLPMSRFDTLILDGKFPEKQDNFTVLGRGLAYRLGLNSNDVFSNVTFYSPKRGNSFSLSPEEAFNEIISIPTGLFSINDEFDFKYALINIKQARELFGYNQEISALEIGLQKGADLAETKIQISKILGDSFFVKDRNEQNALLFKTLQSEKLWTFIILSFILVVATFNIIGALTMLIIEKKKDIKILHHMGADVKLIRRIFLTEGILITVLGAVLGLLLGTTLCLLQIQFGFISFEEGFVIDAYPITLKWIDFVIILVTVLSIGFFASWFPVKLFTERTLLQPIKED